MLCLALRLRLMRCKEGFEGKGTHAFACLDGIYLSRPMADTTIAVGSSFFPGASQTTPGAFLREG